MISALKLVTYVKAGFIANPVNLEPSSLVLRD